MIGCSPLRTIMQDVYSVFGTEYIAVEGAEVVSEANILTRFADGSVKIMVNHVAFFHSMVSRLLSVDITGTPLTTG